MTLNTLLVPITQKYLEDITMTPLSGDQNSLSLSVIFLKQDVYS